MAMITAKGGVRRLAVAGCWSLYASICVLAWLDLISWNLAASLGATALLPLLVAARKRAYSPASDD